MAKKRKQGVDRRLQRVFTVAALLIPVFLLVLAEVVLRAVGYGSEAPLFVPFEPAHGYLRASDDVASRYFVNEATLPTIPVEIFRAEKEPRTVRIVVQGGSSAAGFPYYFGAGLADQLEPCLSDMMPDRRVEVIGTAMAAVNSFTLLDLSEEIIALRPDAIVIYAGHNEYYGAMGVGSSQSFGRSPVLKRWYLALRHFRLVQALRNTLSAIVGLGPSPAAGKAPGVTLMERMVGNQRVAYGSDAFRDGVEQFRTNLQLLVDRYAEEGIPVVLGTLASNVRDQPPFVDGTQEGHDVDELMGQLAKVAALDTSDAISALRALVDEDSVFASARFRLGHYLVNRDRMSEPRELLYEAKDRDQLRFRAPETFNDIIRTMESRERRVFVADVLSALEAATQNGIVDSTLMTEHLHPNLKGYRLLTRAYLTTMVEAGLFGLTDHTVDCEPVVTRLDSLVGSYRLRRLKGSWPFKPAGSAALNLLSIEGHSFEEDQALKIFRDELGRAEALEQLREHYVAEGKFEDARIAALALAQEFPFMGKPLADAGDAAMSQGQVDRALGYYERSLEREESGVAHRMFGTILLQKGRREEAIPHLERALVLEPNHPQTLYNLAGALALDGRHEEARRTVESLLAKYPGHEAGRKLLESLPE